MKFENTKIVLGILLTFGIFGASVVGFCIAVFRLGDGDPQRVGSIFLAVILVVIIGAAVVADIREAGK